MTDTKNSSEDVAGALIIRPFAQERMLTRAEFQELAEVPPEVEWFANIRNHHTRRAYKADIRQFMGFAGIEAPEEFRQVTRSHVIAFRTDLEAQGLAAATVRRKLSALSDLFDWLCEANAITHNPVKGVERPSEGANEGKTPALSDAQARKLLEAPPDDTVKGLRDRAILSTLLYHALRREELCKLRVKDFSLREGVMHFAVRGKRSKIRYIPVEPGTIRRIQEYLDIAGHGETADAPLFRPVKNNRNKKGLEVFSRKFHRSPVLAAVETECFRLTIELTYSSGCLLLKVGLWKFFDCL